MSYYKTVGIVLGRSNLGEADRIVTFITPDYGKLRAVAKGVRRIKSRMAGHLEPFSEVELMLAKGRNLDVITSARLRQSGEGVTAAYDRLAQGFLFAEMIDKLTDEESSAVVLYARARECLADLGTSGASALTELYFKLGLLDALGYRPHLESCVVCQRREEGSYFFRSDLGGIVDGDCSGTEARSVSVNQIKLWRLCLDRPLGRLRGIDGAEALAAQSLVQINDFVEYTFGRRFRAAEMFGGG